jgi:tRNA-dihydrouridine synthase B
MRWPKGARREGPASPLQACSLLTPEASKAPRLGASLFFAHSSASSVVRMFTMQKHWENPARAAAPPPGARVPASFSVGGLTLVPATVLAPMSGVTDTVFRRFIRDLGGCGLIMTEFTSADGVLRDRKTRGRYLHFYEDEHPISAQLFGSDPRVLSDAARLVEDLGFDLVDLNLGCPARKVVKCNGGSGLLRDLPRIRGIFESIRAAVKLPFTVKFRAGWNENELVYLDLARMAEDCGLQAVAMHARTREQGYAGEACWEWIRHIKEAVRIPVIGNGDVRRPEDAVAMVAATGCDAVMIGRAAASNPWIFRQIAQHAAAGRYDEPSDADRHRMIRTYFRMLVEEGMPGAIGKMKQFASWFTHGVRNGSALRKAVYEARSEQEVLERVDRFFESALRATPSLA